ncbi:MAG TPA: GTPase Era, partial [Polyangia bacterium]|nr:GTPase Era [Polyangia bacterium]
MSTPDSAASTVAGTVVILGRPNVGKSTLLNALVGEKLAIVTPKPQTTRNRIVGVWNGTEGQIVFVDTPGVHGAKKGLNRFMVQEALGAIDEVDAALLVVDAGERRPGDEERQILRQLETARRPTVLAVNKVDKVKDKGALLPLLADWERVSEFSALVPIS